MEYMKTSKETLKLLDDRHRIIYKFITDDEINVHNALGRSNTLRK